MTIIKQRTRVDVRIAQKWLALIVSFVLGLICAVALANGLLDNSEKEFVSDQVETERNDEQASSNRSVASR